MRNSIGFIVLTSTFLTLVIIGGSGYVAYEQFGVRLTTDSVAESVERHTSSTPSTGTFSSLADLIAEVNPAVVSVIATLDVPVYERYFEEYDPWGGWFGGGIAVPRVRERGTEEREVGGGSGFFVSADGLIVTNRHVVADTDARYSVVTSGGVMYDAEVVARDPVLDIAILRAILANNESESFPFLRFGDSDALRLGDDVVVIGNALAEFRNSVSVGIVSGLARNISARGSQGQVEQLEQVIQTDAAINPGNSGGPMINTQGEVVGVSVATTQGADNISFALPATAVEQIVTSVIAHGEIQRPYLGVRYTMINEQLQAMEDLPVSYGAYIQDGSGMNEPAVLPGSPAAAAGLAAGDIITVVDGVSLQERSLASLLREKAVGATVTLDVIQETEEKQITVVLEKMS